MSTNFLRIERQTDTAHKLQDMHLCRKKHGVVHFRIQANVHIWRYALLQYQVLMKSSNIPCVIIRNIIMHFQQWIRDTHFCQTNLRHPKRLFEHDLLHNDWCSLYALLPARKSITFCKFWYQIRTCKKTCSYAPLLVNPRVRYPVLDSQGELVSLM